jgi:dihydrofolate reductase
MSRKVISYIATSLDGRIARLDGSVDWLNSLPNPDNSDYGYADFIETIDATIMGNATYKEILGFDIEFPYKELDNYVFTRNTQLNHEEYVQFVSSHFDTFIKNLQEDEGKNIWLMGGGQLNSLFIKNGWLDEMRVFVMPIILGEGLPLFSKDAPETMLKLEESKTYRSGVVELTYNTWKAKSH